MNDFSIVCRVLGILFNRQPQDPILAPLFNLIEQGKLIPHWSLEQDVSLLRLQQSYQPQKLAQDYAALFTDVECYASPFASDYPSDFSEQQVRTFLQQRGMPLTEIPADHFGTLLLAASWIEDQTKSDEIQAQITLFDEYLLSWCGLFLEKVETYSTASFYTTLAQLSQAALQAMRDELKEEEERIAT